MKGTITAIILFISGFCSFKISSAEFHFVNIFMNYTSAQSFCRDKFTDLATVGNSSDVRSLAAVAPDNAVKTWIGLQIADAPTWYWAKPEQKLIFLNWEKGEPNGTTPESCGAMNSDGRWFESECNTKRGFVCEGNDSHGPIFVADKKSWRQSQDHCRGLSSELVGIQSAAENSIVQNGCTEASMWIGLFKDPWQWSDGDTSSFRFWKTNQPNTKDHSCVVAVLNDNGKWNNIECNDNHAFFCHGARKITPTPSPVTQHTVGTAGHILLSPVTQHTTTQTAATVPPTDQTTLQSSPVSATTATTHTAAPAKNLILVQKNMSWMEAWSYCRNHHMALVSVHSKELQDSVGRVAENATSPHVWLGLRYACSFHFWFWIKWGAGCYQNWAPGHGAEGPYDCGMAGALETTRGQRWVGLPETEELNFICLTCAEATPDLN